MAHKTQITPCQQNLSLQQQRQQVYRREKHKEIGLIRGMPCHAMRPFGGVRFLRIFTDSASEKKSLQFLLLRLPHHGEQIVGLTMLKHEFSCRRRHSWNHNMSRTSDWIEMVQRRLFKGRSCGPGKSLL